MGLLFLTRSQLVNNMKYRLTVHPLKDNIKFLKLYKFALTITYIRTLAQREKDPINMKYLKLCNLLLITIKQITVLKERKKKERKKEKV